MLKDLLETQHCFKLVCGAGNEDIEEIKRLVYVYSIAGCRFFDLSANLEVIKAAKEALELAKVYEAYLCVSVGIKNDPHVKKAVIDYDRYVTVRVRKFVRKVRYITARLKNQSVSGAVNAGKFVQKPQFLILLKRRI